MGLTKILIAALAGFASTTRAAVVPQGPSQDISPRSSAATQNFNNPVIWEDLADNDVFRVNDSKGPRESR